jgi:outer membrane biogenesis lipoprotein LolB
MKHIHIFSIIICTSLLIGCSEIPENNDPVIGIWAQTQAPKETTAKYMEREEWIFNDAYLGRYHLYQGSELVIQSDFQWEATGEFYTLQYPGLSKEAAVVQIKQTSGGTILAAKDGSVMATRE